MRRRGRAGAVLMVARAEEACRGSHTEEALAVEVVLSMIARDKGGSMPGCSSMVARRKHSQLSMWLLRGHDTRSCVE